MWRHPSRYKRTIAFSHQLQSCNLIDFLKGFSFIFNILPILDSDLSIVYLSNRTNYKALAEIGCKTIDEDGDQSYLHSSVYSSLSQTEGNRNIDYLSKGMINNNHILLTCMENGWTFLKENNVLSTTTSKYNYETEGVTPTLVCVTNTCGPPNVVSFLNLIRYLINYFSLVFFK